MNTSPQKDPRHEPDLQTYKDAVWDFLLEHCDLTERGAFFVKFHASSRADFEKRVRARWKYGYHRVDERTGFDIRQKEADAALRRKAHENAKAAKKRKHILSREEQKKAFAALEAERLAKVAPVSPVINSEVMQGVAQPLYTRVKLWLKSKLKNRKSSNASIAALPPLPREVSPATSEPSMMA